MKWLKWVLSMALVFCADGSFASSGEMDSAMRENIEKQAKQWNGYKGKNAASRQDEELVKLLDKHKDVPAAQIWIRRSFDINVLIPKKGPDGKLRRQNYWSAWDAWAKEQDFQGDALAVYRAWRLRAHPDPRVFSREFAEWQPELSEKTSWAPHEVDYFHAMRRMHQLVLDRRDGAAFRDSWARFVGPMKEKHAAHPGFKAALKEMVASSAYISPPILPADEWAGLLRPEALALPENTQLNDWDWQRIMLGAIRIAPKDVDFIESLFAKAEKECADKPWLWLAKSRYAANGIGNAEEASRLRAFAAGQAAIAGDSRTLQSALREEVKVALAQER